MKTIQEEFDSALKRVTSKLWDDRSRNKSKGKRKRLSKEEEKNLGKLERFSLPQWKILCVHCVT